MPKKTKDDELPPVPFAKFRLRNAPQSGGIIHNSRHRGYALPDEGDPELFDITLIALNGLPIGPTYPPLAGILVREAPGPSSPPVAPASLNWQLKIGGASAHSTTIQKEGFFLVSVDATFVCINNPTQQYVCQLICEWTTVDGVKSTDPAVVIQF